VGKGFEAVKRFTLVLTAAAAVLVAGCNHASHVVPPESTIVRAPIPRRYDCTLISQTISIDGRLDDSAWRTAPWSEVFVDIEGAVRPQPRFQTRMKMLWDEQYLYVGAVMDEPHVWGTLTQRDQIVFHDNDFEIFIDPDGDTRNYYEVEVNALGTIFDLFLPRTYLDGGPPDHDWNMAGMRWAVHVEGSLNDATSVDAGWSVEFALPWNAFAVQGGMPCPPNAGDEWRINFSRVQWQHEIIDGHYRKVAGTKEDNWVWSPQGVIDMHRPQRWGFVRFTTEAGVTAGAAGK
jgi:hypothetical protein